jgi:hypothetical protein
MLPKLVPTLRWNHIRFGQNTSIPAAQIGHFFVRFFLKKLHFCAAGNDGNLDQTCIIQSHQDFGAPLARNDAPIHIFLCAE